MMTRQKNRLFFGAFTMLFLHNSAAAETVIPEAQAQQPRASCQECVWSLAEGFNSARDCPLASTPTILLDCHSACTTERRLPMARAVSGLVGECLERELPVLMRPAFRTVVRAMDIAEDLLQRLLNRPGRCGEEIDEAPLSELSPPELTTSGNPLSGPGSADSFPLATILTL